MKRWRVLGKIKNQKSKIEEIVKILLKNRGLRTKKQIKQFFSPPNPYTLESKTLGFKNSELKKAVKRIKRAIAKKESIVVYSDFDADGVCGAAILWETLNFLGAKVMPYIPDRIREGYGLSKRGIEKALKNYGVNLIITVDQGITAHTKIEYAKKLGIEVIVTDHHLPPKRLPKATAIVHTTSLSGAGVAWVLARELSLPSLVFSWEHLALVAIGTIADLIPLLFPNRSFVKYGLSQLNKTERIGLNALFKEAGLEKGKIGTYEVGFIIAPRLNAMGRLVHAMDSLRLLCTKDPGRASSLAQKLDKTNRERQKLMEEATQQAKEEIMRKGESKETKKLIFLSHSSYHEGIIGLVAGKLVEEFYRPAVVVSKGESHSKASARSINGFNIVEAIRSCSDLLIDCGGHPMAAGFTMETKYLEEVKSKLQKLAEEIPPEKLTKSLKIDCEISLSDITFSLYKKISQFAPFGIGNPEPVFASRKVIVRDAQVVGNEGKHLRFLVSGKKMKQFNNLVMDCIAFNMGHLFPKLSPEKPIDIAYTISLGEWNNEKRLELKIKDIKM